MILIIHSKSGFGNSFFSVMNVSNKISVITGAAKGLGKAFAEELLKNGAKVVLTDFNEKLGQSTLAEFSQKYSKDKVLFIKCDVTNDTQTREMFQSVKSKFGNLDIMINNAGCGKEFDGWEMTIDLNVTGTLRSTMLALEQMRRDKGGNGGVIINVSSMAGIHPNPCGPVYSASKGAILMYSLSLAKNPELAANGIRINVLAPAFVQTSMYQGLMDESSIHVPQIAKMILSKVGVMTPQYVAENMMELIVDESKTGAIMKLSQNGGKDYHILPVS